MKLGFWNRLAIVAAGVAMLIAPAWYWAKENSEYFEVMERLREMCVEGAQIQYDKGGTLDAFSAARDHCFETFQGVEGGPGWDAYGLGLATTAVICVALYLLILGASAITKWVWRGRKNTKAA